jgi:hypothetical protein
MRGTSLFLLIFIGLIFIAQAKIGEKGKVKEGIIMADKNKTSWPELIGLSGEAAKTRLEEENPGKEVDVVPDGSMVTMDYREDRIRIYTDGEGKVVKAPKFG